MNTPDGGTYSDALGYITRNANRIEEASMGGWSVGNHEPLYVCKDAGVEETDVMVAALMFQYVQRRVFTLKEIETKFNPRVRGIIQEILDHGVFHTRQKQLEILTRSRLFSPGAAAACLAYCLSDLGWKVTITRRYLDSKLGAPYLAHLFLLADAMQEHGELSRKLRDMVSAQLPEYIRSKYKNFAWTVELAQKIIDDHYD